MLELWLVASESGWDNDLPATFSVVFIFSYMSCCVSDIQSAHLPLLELLFGLKLFFSPQNQQSQSSSESDGSSSVPTILPCPSPSSSSGGGSFADAPMVIPWSTGKAKDAAVDTPSKLGTVQMFIRDSNRGGIASPAGKIQITRGTKGNVIQVLTYMET